MSPQYPDETPFMMHRIENLVAERDRLRDLLGRTIEYMEPPPIEDAPRFAELLDDIRKELEEEGMTYKPPKCTKCGDEAKAGTALLNSIIGFPDFPGDTGMEPGSTLSRSGPARIVGVWKCPRCGHSWTP